MAGEFGLGEEEAARRAEAAEMEFGDVLFALVNVGRRMGIDAESALRASNAKFRARWAAMGVDPLGFATEAPTKDHAGPIRLTMKMDTSNNF